MDKWHKADEVHPPVNEEVIALAKLDGEDSLESLCFAHIVDSKVVKDYNGWNIPGVKYWIDFPQIPD